MLVSWGWVPARLWPSLGTRGLLRRHQNENRQHQAQTWRWQHLYCRAQAQQREATTWTVRGRALSLGLRPPRCQDGPKIAPTAGSWEESLVVARWQGLSGGLQCVTALVLLSSRCLPMVAQRPFPASGALGMATPESAPGTAPAMARGPFSAPAALEKVTLELALGLSPALSPPLWTPGRTACLRVPAWGAQERCQTHLRGGTALGQVSLQDCPLGAWLACDDSRLTGMLVWLCFVWRRTFLALRFCSCFFLSGSICDRW